MFVQLNAAAGRELYNFSRSTALRILNKDLGSHNDLISDVCAYTTMQPHVRRRVLSGFLLEQGQNQGYLSGKSG
jgi:hypothetical protein